MTLEAPGHPALQRRLLMGVRRQWPLLGTSEASAEGPHPVEGKDGACLPDHPLSPWAGEEPGGREYQTQEGRGWWVGAGREVRLKEVGSHSGQGKWLLDWNDSNLENLHLETGADFPKRALKNGTGRVLKPVRPCCFLGQRERELASPETVSGRCGPQLSLGLLGERSTAPPKSPCGL